MSTSVFFLCDGGARFVNLCFLVFFIQRTERVRRIKKLRSRWHITHIAKLRHLIVELFNLREGARSDFALQAERQVKENEPIQET